jgi:hypothetical protein
MAIFGIKAIFGMTSNKQQKKSLVSGTGAL